MPLASVVDDAVVLFEQLFRFRVQLCGQLVNSMLSAAVLAAEADLLAPSDYLQFVMAALSALHITPPQARS